MKSIFFVLSLLCITLQVDAQYYDDVLTYTTSSTPVNGVKIKTNLPFTNNSQMPTIFIEGYAYNTGEPISLILDYFINADVFQKSKVSTSGSHNPPITLAAENGKVVIFIDSKIYYQRFHVRAFASGKSADIASSYSGWTAVDSTLSASATAALLVPYQNRFSGDVYFPGSSVVDSSGNWGIGTIDPVVKLSVYGPNNNDGAMSFQSNVDSRFYIAEGDNMLRIGGLNATSGVINVINTGNVGIGTTNPGTNKLSVEGTIGARKMQVKQTTWADFVFQPDYQLPPLQEVANYISTNKHLPGIPTTEQVQKDGIDLGEMNKLLLQKMEELTLYIIAQQKQIDQLKVSKN